MLLILYTITVFLFYLFLPEFINGAKKDQALMIAQSFFDSD